MYILTFLSGYGFVVREINAVFDNLSVCGVGYPMQTKYFSVSKYF